MDELEAIRARADAATPGPWFTRAKRDDYGVDYVTSVQADNPYHPVDQQIADQYGVCQICMMVDQATDADHVFIAAARTDIPALLAALTTAQADRDALHQAAFAAWAAYDEDGVAHPPALQTAMQALYTALGAGDAAVG